MSLVIRVTDFAAPELDVYARTTENQLVCREDPENGKFIAETPMVIERALDAGYVPISFLMEEKYLENQGKAFMEHCPDVPVYTAELSILQNLIGYPLTRGMLCAMRRRPVPKPSALCKTSRRIAVLENVMNPTNVGAIFRSAAALGMDAVLLTPGCSDPFYRRAIRVAMGTVFQIPWTYVDEDWPELLKINGFSTVAMALCPDSRALNDPEIAAQERLAIVLGTEGDGLAPATIAACTSRWDSSPSSGWNGMCSWSCPWWNTPSQKRNAATARAAAPKTPAKCSAEFPSPPASLLPPAATGKKELPAIRINNAAPKGFWPLGANSVI